MRTSLNETLEIENLLLQHGNLPDRLLTEAKTLTNAELRKTAEWQLTAYEVIRLHGRQKLLQEIRQVEHQLFSMSKYQLFQHRIMSIFKFKR